MPDSRRRIQLLVVEDSLFFREALNKELSKNKDFNIVASASDPFEARYEIMLFDPDVMLLDINLPRMNGVEFIKRLMAQYPIPIVVMSSNAELISQAIRAGAMEGVEKPSQGRDIKAFVREVTAKIKLVAKSDTKGSQPADGEPQGESANWRGNAAVRGAWCGSGAVSRAAEEAGGKPQTKAGARQGHGETHAGAEPDAADLPANARATSKKIIAIGASTGGTDAIAAIMAALPAGIPGIVIVQHMPMEFTGMFASRLNGMCKFPVREAKTGDRILTGTAFVAPGNLHLKVVKNTDAFTIMTQKGEKVSGHCPSVDVLFESVAACAGAKAIGVILTGMGNDGADGLLRMRLAGAPTIGQDERSCVVYGMPKVAYEKGAVLHQLPLGKIAAQIVALL